MRTRKVSALRRRGHSGMDIGASAQSKEAVNPKTGMTHTEAKDFVRNHFEEFVNRKNLKIGEVNFAPEFVDHGADVPSGTPPGPAGAMQYVGGAYKKFPDIQVEILDVIAEEDRVVVRNRWTGTEAATGKIVEFAGIVIWRIAHRQLAERWAYLTPPREAQ
jgi:predicted ester cyclase